MGWDSLRLLRLRKLKELGIVPKEVQNVCPKRNSKMGALNARQKEEYARDMEVYAAMIDYLDMSIGRISDLS